MKTNFSNSANTISRPVTASIALIITIIFLSSCAANAGYRHYDYEPSPSRSFDYHYYPNAHVYFDSRQHLYHYHHKQRGWQSVKKLPKYIHIDKHRQYPVRSNHRKPWKNQHLQKKHLSHFDRQDEKSLRRRHAYKEDFPRHEITDNQKRLNHERAHHYGNRSNKKSRTDVSNQRPRIEQYAYQKGHVNSMPGNKFTAKKSNNRHASADNQAGHKMLRKQQHRKSKSHRKDSKQGKDRIARDGRSRQGEKQRRD